MKQARKMLSVLLVVLMLFTLCACNKPVAETTPSTTTGTPELVIPSSVYGTWYPHPDMSDVIDVPVEINADGTCILGTETYQWTTQSITENQVVLIAGTGENEIQITFSHLTYTVPLLTITGFGVFNQYPNLWKYMVDWYCDDTNDVFALSFNALAKAGCKLTINGDDLKIEVMSGNTVTHTIDLSGSQAIVTDSKGNQTVYKALTIYE